MSDERTITIHKLATELVQELLNSTRHDGDERWFHMIVRKLERVPDRCPPKKPSFKLPLRIGRYELGRLGSKVAVNVVQAKPGWTSGLSPGGDEVFEADQWDEKDIAKLKLWLNGE